MLAGKRKIDFYPNQTYHDNVMATFLVLHAGDFLEYSNLVQIAFYQTIFEKGFAEVAQIQKKKQKNKNKQRGLLVAMVKPIYIKLTFA